MIQRDLDAFYLSAPQRTLDWINRVNSSPAFNRKILDSFAIPPPDPGKTRDYIDVSTELWLSQGEPLCLAFILLDRHLMPMDRGPDVGCMGSVVWLGSQSSPLATTGILRILPLLRKLKYSGPISLRTLVTENRVTGVELHAGFLHNSIYPFLEMYRGNAYGMIIRLFSGLQREMTFKSPLAIGLEIGIRPFPWDDLSPICRLETRIPGLNKQNIRHFWSRNLQEDQEGFYTTGGTIGTITARGDAIPGFTPLRDARRRVLRTARNLGVADLIYREDVGLRYESDFRRLSGWGMVS